MQLVAYLGALQTAADAGAHALLLGSRLLVHGRCASPSSHVCWCSVFVAVAVMRTSGAYTAALGTLAAVAFIVSNSDMSKLPLMHVLVLVSQVGIVLLRSQLLPKRTKPAPM